MAYTNLYKIGGYLLRSFFFIIIFSIITSCSIPFEPIFDKTIKKENESKINDKFYVIKENGKVIWKKKIDIDKEKILDKIKTKEAMKKVKRIRGFIEKSQYNHDFNKWVYIIRDVDSKKLTTFFGQYEIPFNDKDLVMVDIVDNIIQNHVVIVKNYKNEKAKQMVKKRKKLRKRTLSRKTPWISVPKVENIDFN